MASRASGRRHRNAPKTNELIALDISVFARDGLAGEVSRVLSWSNGECCVGRAHCSFSDRSAKVYFQNGDGVVARQELELSTTYPHFGGTRRWFNCPECCRRCRVLYHLDRFVCRHCAGAVYPSQYDTVRVPGEAKAKKLRDLFGVNGGQESLFLSKPKGMHWRKFREIERFLWDAEIAFDDYIQASL